MTDHHPESSTDVGPTTHEGDSVESAHDVMLRRIRVEVELYRSVVGELDGADTHSLRSNIHLLDDRRQKFLHVRKPFDPDAVRSVDDEDDVAATSAR